MDRPTEFRAMRGRVEARATGAKRIGGYAAKFNTRSQNLGGFVERIDPAFFNKSAGDGWPGVMCRYNHEDDALLGTTSAGTLRLEVDGTGLEYECDVPETRADVYELVSRGDVSQSSFAFVVYEDDWSLDDAGFPLRTLLSGRLVDVAPVNTPAYADTSTGLRGLAEARGLDVDEVTRLARDGALASVLSAAATVVDLGSRSESPPDPAPTAQASATPPVRIQLMRRELELKRHQPR